MVTKANFSCFIIGSDALLTECGDILLAQGHEVRGVVSLSPRVAQWANLRGLATIDPTAGYVEWLRGEPFDYLFAITHMAVLPDEVLALPRKSAINFHDGPLPRYAGINAPAWALLQGETHYGITWHLMTSGVDAGSILRQVTFEIGRDETSLSLNTKCFAHAIESFAELVRELSSEAIRETPQDLTQRSYFGRNRRLPDACVIDWTRPAADLEAMVRALDFGERHANTLGVAKVYAGADTFIVTRAEARAGEGGEASAPPGTVMSVDPGAIDIATGEGIISLTGAATLAGDPVALEVLAGRANIVAGGMCEHLPAAVRVNLTSLDRELCRAEPFWVERLMAFEPALMPPLEVAQGDGKPARHSEMVLEVPDVFAGGLDRVESLITAFGIYCARMGQKETFALGMTSRSLVTKIGDLHALVAWVVPLPIRVDWSLGFRAMRERTAEDLAELHAHTTYWRDVVARHPELHRHPGCADGSAWPVCVAVDTEAPATSRLALVLSTEKSEARLCYDTLCVTEEQARRLADQLITLLTAAARDPGELVGRLPLLTDQERSRVLIEWNKTSKAYTEACVHHLFEEQAARSPEATALVFEDREVSYRWVNERANQLAGHLRTLAVGPDVLVGIHLDRSIDLVVAALAVMKAGGGYVPLDPDYPSERLALMLEDAKLRVVLSDERHASSLSMAPKTRVVRLDADWNDVARYPRTDLEGGAEPGHLAYVIYTSGSTGTPKGVMVEHRNVVSFFAGMDERIPHDPPGTWLAVTSLSFDISVLELFWALSRGFRVVIHRDRQRPTGRKARSPGKLPLDFSLFYFASDEAADEAAKYDLLLRGAKFADENGFAAVWTPERHFHAFGGLYPNPVVTAAALAVLTEKIQIRAGSVVLPLHHPIRIAEGWAMVDNLSGGRVGISFASGWQPNDFVLRPEAFQDAKAIMFRDIEVVEALWRGDSVSFPGPRGDMIPVRTLPRPIQKNLPIWITTAGNIDTYKMAGQIGANVLTHLLGQSIEQLAPKIEAYRAARGDHGHDPDSGVVSLMLHTFVGRDPAEVRDTVRGPLKRYLGSSLELLKQYAWAFPAFSRPKNVATEGADELAHLSDEERDAMLEHAFSRYYETSGLFGRPEDCMQRVRELEAIGVTELACLIDFGIPDAEVLVHLGDLARLRTMAAGHDAPELGMGDSIGELIERHGVTHLQCTPSMARMLLDDVETRSSLRKLSCVMLGGEALPVELVRSVRALTGATLLNMYGPTETTVWSTTALVRGDESSISIGRPIANTRVYLLDVRKEPVPLGTLGELYIAGHGVARGYLYRDELTAQRFLPDPFAKMGRMYRTGDMARFSNDGQLEFAGRRDEQVKIRGHRVELQEVEAAIARNPEIYECAVVMREDVPGDQRLVAYVVSRQGKLDGNALRETLRARLPEFMIPSHIVSLSRLPHTPNRKIDRKALPRPQDGEAVQSFAFAAPETEIELTIAKLWQEVLGRDRIGADDNFFDVGGHSLLVVKMHRKLCELVAHPVSLTDLYRFPTIRSLSRFLTTESPAPSAEQGSDRAAKRREMMGRRRSKLVEE